MLTQHNVGSVNPRLEGFLRVRNRWMWFFWLGTALVLVGAFAVGAAFLTTLTTVLVFGVLLLVGGVVELVSAILGRAWKGVSLHATVGLIHLVVGALMLEHPARAAEGLTLLLAAAFLVGGVIRVGHALTEPVDGRAWALVTGVIAVAFGLSIWQQWPESGLWAIGLFIGIDLMLIGWSWVILGLLLKKPQSGGTETERRSVAHPAEDRSQERP
jgi:uncharacterized membrane protein HdeD (DUF308 family)